MSFFQVSAWHKFPYEQFNWNNARRAVKGEVGKPLRGVPPSHKLSVRKANANTSETSWTSSGWCLFLQLFFRIHQNDEDGYGHCVWEQRETPHSLLWLCSEVLQPGTCLAQQLQIYILFVMSSLSYHVSLHQAEDRNRLDILFCAFYFNSIIGKAG